MGKIRVWFDKKMGGEGLFFKFAEEAVFFFFKINNINRFLLRKRINEYFNKNELIKIQFGSGKKELEGFLNTDILGKIPINITKKLPFKENSVDVMYSNHVIEHIYYKQFKRFLKDSFRCLKEGGIHMISTPSIPKLIKSIYENEKTKKKLIELYGGGKAYDSARVINNIMHMSFMHKFIYDFESIQFLGKEAGFSKIFSVDNYETPDETIKRSLKKDEPWDAITETFVLVK